MNSMRHYHYHSECDIGRKVNKGCGDFGPITEQFCLNPKPLHNGTVIIIDSYQSIQILRHQSNGTRVSTNSVLLKHSGNAKTAVEMVEGVMDSDAGTLLEVEALMKLLCEFTFEDKLRKRQLEISQDGEQKGTALNELPES